MITFATQYLAMSHDDNKMRYAQRGVSANKEDVHAAIKGLDQGLYPHAFCKILPDIVAGSDDYVNLMHADTAGTKTSLAYMYWKETGDLSVWEGIVQDSIVMNIDDMACVGCVDNIILSSTIGRNKNLIDGDVIKTIIQYTQKFADQMSDHGVSLHLAGGETADVGDIVRTIDVGFTAFARMKKEDVIDSNISPGDYIVGMASYGQSTYETGYNGGMGSNGLTSARHDVFHHEYAAKYPDSYDHLTPKDLVYVGSKKLTDVTKVDGDWLHVGKMVLSPTRTFLPILKQVVHNHRSSINAMIHCTGGAHTKVLKFLKQDVCIIKDNLLETPPLFRIIHNESGIPHKEMYQVFNMGTRLEIYCKDKIAAEEIVAISRSFNVDAQIIGRVEAADKSSVEVKSEFGEFTYS